MAILAVALAPDVIFSALNYADRQFRISVEQKIELLFLSRKAEIDLAAYEDPKFNDLLNRGRSPRTLPMVDLLEAQFSNLQSLVEVAVASAILLTLHWQLFVLVLLGRASQVCRRSPLWREDLGHLRRQGRDPQTLFRSPRHFYDLRWLAELKLFQNVRHFHGLLTRLLDEFNTQQRHVERRKLLWLAASIAAGGGCIGTAIVLLVEEVRHGEMPIGTMVFVLGSVGMLQNALSGFFLAPPASTNSAFS